MVKSRDELEALIGGRVATTAEIFEPLPPLALWHRTNPPTSAAALEELKTWTPDELRAAGLVRWDHTGPDGFALWLFPAPWFYAIPDGLEVTSIMGNTGPWEAAAASTDQRAGCLAYGFRIKHRRVST